MNKVDNMPIASMQKRISAFVLDDIIVAVLLFVIFYDQIMLLVSSVPTVITAESIETFQNQMQHFNSNNLFLIFSLKVLYHAFLIWQNNGMTIGKYIMKIRVIAIGKEENLTFFKALLRAMLRIVSEIIFYIGFLFAFFLPLRQTFHDKLSNCVVIDV